ncbi:lipoprotein, putative [Thiobacillus denitrificans ATCC 25259]|uniref:Lipoprotein, putative n=1 Tax=Thiobacillus denitrificans (strain ATCC 25259 / T1) TaxID=292415 RepID=Q3SME4_THIDA|nr:LEA type 2 family protein [Thiobacillus denitrificans]AAZ96102.1 lipoprotein, putative [Thiobacillus denitrificans ATCC 25259]
MSAMLRRALASCLVFILAACSALAPKPLPPEVSVAAVEVRSVGVFEQRFEILLRVTNPNAFALTIEALEFDLEVNGQPFARGLSPLPTPLGATAETEVVIEAVTRSDDLIRQLGTLARGQLKQGVPYRLRGRVKTDKSPRWLPFEHAGVYGAPRPPDGTI